MFDDAPSTARHRAAERMAEAVTAWIDTLTPDQRALAIAGAPGEDVEDDRLTWFFTPTDHGGLTLHEQNAVQQGLAMRIVASGLSREGFVTASTVIGMENVLDRLESWRVDWGRPRGRDPQLYYLRVFGAPGDRVWAWRFGGHHVSLNNLVVDGELVSTTPSFFGSDPAEIGFAGGGTLRPLGACEDPARQLLAGMRPAQRDVAVLLDRAPADIVSGNRTFIDDGDRLPRMDDVWRGRFAEPRLADYIAAIHDREVGASGLDESDDKRLALTRTPKGIAARALDEGQRALLRRAIAAFTDRAPQEIAEELRAFYAADENLDPVHFAWAGPAERGRKHYYRVQGPRMLIEYDNTQRDGNHCHAVWRDPVADFGLDVLYEHVDVFHRPADAPPWPVPAREGRA